MRSVLIGTTPQKVRLHTLMVVWGSNQWHTPTMLFSCISWYILTHVTHIGHMASLVCSTSAMRRTYRLVVPWLHNRTKPCCAPTWNESRIVWICMESGVSVDDAENRFWLISLLKSVKQIDGLSLSYFLNWDRAISTQSIMTHILAMQICNIIVLNTHQYIM